MNIQPLQNKYFKSFIDLDINNKFENFTFNQAVYFISYDKNITICEQLLKYLYEKTNIDIMISVREFLSLYIIYYFHNEVLSTQKNETETLLYESSKEIVLYNFDDLINNNTYDQNEINILLYVKKLNTFGILFHIWKKKDKESQKEIYISLYIDYTEEIKKFIDKANDINRFKEYEQYINQLLHMKKVIKKCLISLIGKKEYKSIKDTKFKRGKHRFL